MLVRYAEAGNHGHLEALLREIDGFPTGRRKEAVQAAVNRRDPELLRMLLEAGFPADVRDSSGESAMHTAITYLAFPLIDLLADYGATIPIGFLLYLEQNGMTGRASGYIDQGNRIDFKGGFRAFRLALEGENLVTLRALAELGQEKLREQDPSSRYEDSLFGAAVASLKPSCIEVFLDSGYELSGPQKDFLEENGLEELAD
jgi:hypothetical protein